MSMQEILLIRGGTPSRAIDALAAAAEINEVLGKHTQIDIATPESCAKYLPLSSVVRRIIPVSEPDKNAEDADADGDGLGDKLFSMAKSIFNTAGQNVRNYMHLADELRLTEYDVVFDFDFSAFSIAVGKLAKTRKVIGFDPRMIPDAVPGAMLVAHETYNITSEMSNSSLLCQLAARHFGYQPMGERGRLDWQMWQGEGVPQEGAYLLVSPRLPERFMQVAQQSGLPVVPLDQSLPAKTAAGWVQGATAVVGSGVATALAAAYQVPNFYLGKKADKPYPGNYIATPNELAEALAQSMQSAAVAAEAAAAESAAAAAESAAADLEDFSAAADAPPPEESTPKTIQLNKKD